AVNPHCGLAPNKKRSPYRFFVNESESQSLFALRSKSCQFEFTWR
ncbi:hypothetical protein M2147_000375, partial [Ohessyouella blattaphilus]